MSEILTTFFFQHDLRLVALAALICSLSAFSGVAMLAHARRSSGAVRAVWLCVAAISVGFGIWATHFVAMLAFEVGFPVSYDIGATVASLLIAIGVCGAGLGMACLGRRRSDLWLGGAIVGLGISSMHYTGMAALQLGGEVAWNSGLVAASVVAGMVLGAAALGVGAARRNWRSRLAGAGLLTLAICAMHFTAMGAAGFENCYAVARAGEVSPDVLSLAVGVVSILILLAALGGMYLDLRDRKRAELEESRMKGLADAAVEGLMVCDDRTVVAINSSLQRLLDKEADAIVGRPVSDFLAPEGCAALFERTNQLAETELVSNGGETIPVEVVLREVDFGGRLHHAIAVRDLRARKQAESHIRFLAHHDAMTGLANRSSFNDRLDAEISRAAAARTRLAVLCLDLDRFKEVNDLFGHAAGDALLQKVATIIESSLVGSQFAARLGGDEFALILPDLESANQAVTATRALLNAFEQANVAEDGGLISASIGIAMFPSDARNAEQLMTFADTALYCAKGEGRGTYRLFEAQMGAQVRDRRQLEHDLRQAMTGDQLSLVYQPQVDIESGDVTGFEALLRWTHPQRGPIPPSDFIPVAEESGLVLQLGEWVMRTACKEAANWTNPLMVAVNVSPVQLHAPSFVAFVDQVLKETGLSPARLEIEITETAMIRNMNRALSAMRKIKALGIKVAMDDFGTGYSSLSNLRAFPFDRIKVDQSFIRAVHTNDQAAAIVRAVVGLGKGLNLPILAEGVEQLEELEFLRTEICDSAQGYWFGRPQAISVYDDIVRGRHTRIEPAPAANGVRKLAS